MSVTKTFQISEMHHATGSLGYPAIMGIIDGMRVFKVSPRRQRRKSNAGLLYFTNDAGLCRVVKSAEKFPTYRHERSRRSH